MATGDRFRQIPRLTGLEPAADRLQSALLEVLNPALERLAQVFARPRGLGFFKVDLASIASSDTLARFKPGFSGVLESLEFSVDVPATTASKTATLTLSVGGTAVVGGNVVLTTSNCGTKGARIAATDLEPVSFTASDEITVSASAVTAFGEGSGTIIPGWR